MTREEAITRYNAIKARGDFCEYLNEEMVDMAIQALSQEPCQTCRNEHTSFCGNCKNYDEYEPCTDAVSREAIDKYIARLLSGYLYDGERERLEIFSAYLWELPSVNPQPCDDAVSREWLMRKATERFYTTNYFNHISAMIEEAPSVTQKSGKWIEDAKTYYEELNKRGLGVDEYTPYFTDDIACSVCLAKYNTIDNETQFFKHCPNCGARMIFQYRGGNYDIS